MTAPTVSLDEQKTLETQTNLHLFSRTSSSVSFLKKQRALGAWVLLPARSAETFLPNVLNPSQDQVTPPPTTTTNLDAQLHENCAAYFASLCFVVHQVSVHLKETRINFILMVPAAFNVTI